MRGLRSKCTHVPLHFIRTSTSSQGFFALNGVAVWSHVDRVGYNSTVSQTASTEKVRDITSVTSTFKPVTVTRGHVIHRNLQYNGTEYCSLFFVRPGNKLRYRQYGFDTPRKVSLSNMLVSNTASAYRAPACFAWIGLQGKINKARAVSVHAEAAF